MFHLITKRKLASLMISEWERGLQQGYKLGYMEGQVHQRNIDFLAKWECKPNALHQAEQIMREYET